MYTRQEERNVEVICYELDYVNKVIESIKENFNAVHFHGDMAAGERQDIIEKLKNDEVNLIFATNAFGMGIDKPTG